MALPSSGPISLLDIVAEFGGTAPHSLSEYYGAAPGVPTSGPISLSDFYGKANEFTLTISSAVASPNLYNLAVSAGWNKTSKLVVKINATVNTLRLESSMSFPNGIRLDIASGIRVGGVANGGTAIYTRIPVEINNLGIISGGGGAGGIGSCIFVMQTGQTEASGGRILSDRGVGGNGQGFSSTVSTAIASAASGTAAAKKSYTGDVIGGSTPAWCIGGTGGTGGGWGANGGNGQTNHSYGGDYSSWGLVYTGSTGGTAGKYVDGNSYVTWIATGTLLGSVS